MFRRLIVTLLLACCAAAASANQTSIDTSGLSDAQVAELKAQAANAVAKVAKGADPSVGVGVGVTLAATWGQQAASAAEGFAKALGIAARELGVTVNDFLHTDAGKLTAILIVWKIAGAAAVKMLYGLLFVSVGLSIVRIVYLRLFTMGFEKVPYSRFFGMFKGEKMVRVSKSFSDFSSDGEWLAFWVMIALTIAVMLVGGTFF